jgi:hypothetical protein
MDWKLRSRVVALIGWDEKGKRGLGVEDSFHVGFL